jgi:hypothetical protein
MGSDSMKPNYNLGLFYMAIFYPVKIGFVAKRLLTDLQGFVWFTDGSGTLGD